MAEIGRTKLVEREQGHFQQLGGREVTKSTHFTDADNIGPEALVKPPIDLPLTTIGSRVRLPNPSARVKRECVATQRRSISE